MSNKRYEEDVKSRYDPISRGGIHTICRYYGYEWEDIKEGNGVYKYDVLIKTPGELLIPSRLEGMVRWGWDNKEDYWDNIVLDSPQDYIGSKEKILHIWARKWKCFDEDEITRFFIFDMQGFLFRYIDLTREEFDTYLKVKIKMPNNKELDTILWIPLSDWSSVHSIEEFIKW